ncbi:MAG TPA: Nudix family hydrolase [Methylotenera sp.]|nr:Nudix family hydrolase [Methylotenera sp.]
MSKVETANKSETNVVPVVAKTNATSIANQTNITHAAVGVIQHENGLVLLAERPAGKAWSGYWEFPGGKIEENESPKAALKRELQEELGITATLIYPWLTRTFDYEAKYDKSGKLNSPAKTVKLHFFIVAKWDGEPFGMEKQTISWQNPEKISVAPVLPANTPIFNALSLSHVYGITNLRELGEELFFERLKLALINGLMMIQIREKELTEDELLLFVERVAEIAEPYEAKIFLNSAHHNSRQIIKESKLAGLHLTSRDLMACKKKPDEIRCGASCHNVEEFTQAEALGLDYVLLSPVQNTKSHPATAAMGWSEFAKMVKDCSIPVYALGGLQIDDLHEARLHGAHGIAMLRGIWEIAG